MSYETSMVGGGAGGVREPIHAPILLILTDQHLAGSRRLSTNPSFHTAMAAECVRGVSEVADGGSGQVRVGEWREGGDTDSLVDCTPATDVLDVDGAAKWQDGSTSKTACLHLDRGPPTAAAHPLGGLKLGEQAHVWSPPKGLGLGCGIGAGGTVAEVGTCNVDDNEDVGYLLSSDGADGTSSSLDADVVEVVPDSEELEPGDSSILPNKHERSVMPD